MCTGSHPPVLVKCNSHAWPQQAVVLCTTGVVIGASANVVVLVFLLFLSLCFFVHFHIVAAASLFTNCRCGGGRVGVG
jgi:hypothetical protein